MKNIAAKIGFLSVFIVEDSGLGVFILTLKGLRTL
jgi:hypothetical protein